MFMEPAGKAIGKKTLVERAVPKPVRKAFRWMNYHFKEEGQVINSFAKTLPPEQKKEVVELGKNFTTAHSKGNFPRGVRNVASSLVVGQCLWYFVCPALYRIDAVRESPFGWLASGGLDKLFINADDPFFQTGGYSAQVANQAASYAGGSVALGAAALVGELATDFSRCFIEYWTQKKYGVMADGAARAYGQVRPFPMRYSSLEAYQKIISYALRPWTIGTPQQIYSSVYGILGSIWRTGPQLAIVITAGRAVDKLFRKIAEWTRLSKLAKRIVDDAKERQARAMDAIKNIVGEQKFTALQLQLAAESKTFWKWNPFRPALTHAEADRASAAIADFESLRAKAAPLEAESGGEGEDYRRKISCIAARLEAVYGSKRMKAYAPSFGYYRRAESEEVAGGEPGDSARLAGILGEAVSELRTARELK